MSSKSAAVFMSCLALFIFPGLGARGQVTAQSHPLSKLVGGWGLTVFVMGGGQFGGPRCGNTDRPGPSPVIIAPPGDSVVSLAVACNDGSDYAFRLKHDAAAQAYLITVKSKQGIRVDDFPVAYVEGQGWKGAREQLVEGKKVSITATVAPIEGRNWYGWMIAVLPTADIDRGLDDIKRPYFRADLTRRRKAQFSVDVFSASNRGGIRSRCIIRRMATMIPNLPLGVRPFTEEAGAPAAWPTRV